MSINLTPTKSLHQLKNFSSTSYANRNLQSSITKANMFTALVDQHLAKSREENYVLKPAKRSYSESRIYRIYSRSASLKKTPKNQMSQSKKSAEIPEDKQMIEALNKKAGFMLDVREKFEQEMSEKLMLEQKMFELKRRIYEQRKLKDKIHLKNCKLINQRENSMKNTQILKEQSKQNLMLICILASQCTQLDLQLDQAEKMNKKTSRKIEEEQNTISQLKKVVQNTKIKLQQQISRVVELKHLQTIQYKKMTNIYMDMNQLKEEKALLLNHVRSEVDSHS